jgi:hypothetical protein
MAAQAATNLQALALGDAVRIENAGRVTQTPTRSIQFDIDDTDIDMIFISLISNDYFDMVLA